MANTMNTRDPVPARIDGDTPNLRLFALLEAIAQKNEPFTLQTMVEETGLPKPTMHRMLQQLEGAGILQREGNGRHYGTGRRLMRLAESLIALAAEAPAGGGPRARGGRGGVGAPAKPCVCAGVIQSHRARGEGSRPPAGLGIAAVSSRCRSTAGAVPRGAPAARCRHPPAPHAG